MNLPLGQKYSQVYLLRGTPVTDSSRMRLRILGLFNKLSLNKLRVGDLCIAEQILSDLGVELSWCNSYDYRKFFVEADLRDVLDSITIIHRMMSEKPTHSYETNQWIQGIREIFREENISYKLDEQAGVHLAVDIEFEHNKASVLSSLSNSRYSAVITDFQKGISALDQIPPDCKTAIKSLFESTEILFRLIFPRASRLGKTEIKQYLCPATDSLYESDQTAKRSIQKYLNSFIEWVDAVHFYRHGQGTEEPTQPPLTYAIALVSSGASYLRWLGEIDQAIQT